MDNLVAIREKLRLLIKDLTVQNLFCGYGFFKKSDLFGIFFNNVFYVRAKEELAQEIKQLGGVSCLIDVRESHLSLSHYYRLPLSVMDDEALLKSLILRSIKQIKREHLNKVILSQEQIKNLPNLSVKHERLLARIGITDIPSFMKIGAVGAFVKLKLNGYPVNMNTFWALTGALLGRHAYVLSKTSRVSALLELNEALKEVDLKPVKSLLLDDYYAGKIKLDESI